jgi:hypothetical protein
LSHPFAPAPKRKGSEWMSRNTGKKRTAGAKAPFSFTLTGAEI